MSAVGTPMRRVDGRAKVTGAARYTAELAPPGTDLARSWIAFIFEWPFEGVLATYTVHAEIPLDSRSGPWTGRQAITPPARCR